jgi:hypothetical protein
MTPLEVLFAVRGLIPRAESWFKGGLARNVEDRKVSITHPHACKFSLDGAFYRVQHITHAKCGPAYEMVKWAIHPARAVMVASFNDALGTTHTAVLEALDRAIRLAGGTPPDMEASE